MKLKKVTIAILVIALLSYIGGAIPAYAAGQAFKSYSTFGKGRSDYVQDEIVVKFKNDAKPFRVIKVPAGQVKEKIREYLQRNDVEYAEPNYYAQASFIPNDLFYGIQWNFGDSGSGGIGAEQAWDVSSGSGVVVAVIDTGIAYETYDKYVKAPDLAQTAFVAGWDFVNDDAHPNDDNSHGTHVAGTVAQSTNNGIGVAGVAYGVSLMPVKVLNKSGYGTYADIADGIRWAADHGADVINMSLGGSSGSQILLDALAYAYSKNVTIIASAGNDGTGSVSYPAAYDDYVIAVGATRYDTNLAYYSNYGPSLDLVAPGGDINVDQNEDGYPDGILQNTFNPNTKKTKDFGYWFFQGTSMASPHVAGIAALVISNGNATTPDEVRAALQESAVDLGADGRDDIYGYGLVNAWLALQWTGGGGGPVELNQPPTASFSYSTDELAASFNASGSSDADGYIVSYAWNFGDTETGSGMTATHTYAAAGSYTVMLTVTDDDGATATTTRVVTVSSGVTAETLHVEALDASKSLRGASGLWDVSVTVTILDDNHQAVSGALVSASWSGAISGSVSGMTDSSGRITFSTGKMSSGTYVVFTVVDVDHNLLAYDASANKITSVTVYK